MARGSIFVRTLEDKKTKRYDCVLRINGIQKWRTFARKKDAEDYLDKFSTDLRDGTYREITKATFAQYTVHWKATHLIAQNCKASTLNSYLSVFEKWIEPEFEFMGMQSISSAEVNRFKAKLQKAGLQAKTVRNILNLLNKFFVNAIKDSYLRHNPMMGVDKPVASRKKKGRALKPTEVQALLANSEGDTRLVILMAILTGMRRGELFGLFWEHIDFQNKVIHVKQALCWKYGKHIRPKEGDLFEYIPPKSESSIREIDLSPMLMAELIARRNQTSAVTVSGAGEMSVKEPMGLLFSTKDGRPLDPNGFAKRQFSSAVKAAQLGKVRFHDLRHTFGSLKLEQGANVYYVMKQMGHSSIQVTVGVYAHELESRKPEEAAKTDAAIFG